MPRGIRLVPLAINDLINTAFYKNDSLVNILNLSSIWQLHDSF